MKKNRFKYLSVRIALVFGILLGVIAVLLGIIIYSSVSSGRFAVLTAVCVIVLCIGAYGGYYWIYKPFMETNRVLTLFIEGYLFQGVFDLRCPLTPEFEDTMKKVKEMLDTKELISASKKQAEYLALQNQINPHFLYNTLEGIRSEALYAEIDSVAKMTEALATFFRYTISNVENLVTLEDEMSNIRNYFLIQQYRFGNRLNLSIEIDPLDEDEIIKCKMPKLTLQPIVENSIFHGIERKIGIGNLRIKVEWTKDRLLISISDDGLGMAQEQVDELNKKLKLTYLEDVPSQKGKMGGIAIVNVNNRIKLLFGDSYGIYIYSKVNVGTDVNITLPIIKE